MQQMVIPCNTLPNQSPIRFHQHGNKMGRCRLHIFLHRDENIPQAQQAQQAMRKHEIVQCTHIPIYPIILL